MNIKGFLLIVSIFFSVIETNKAQRADAGRVKSISRINGEIEIDGIVDEKAWSAVRPLQLTMHLVRGKSPFLRIFFQ